MYIYVCLHNIRPYLLDRTNGMQITSQGETCIPSPCTVEYFLFFFYIYNIIYIKERKKKIQQYMEAYKVHVWYACFSLTGNLHAICAV